MSRKEARVLFLIADASIGYFVLYWLDVLPSPGPWGGTFLIIVHLLCHLALDLTALSRIEASPWLSPREKKAWRAAILLSSYLAAYFFLEIAEDRESWPRTEG